jgi:hypothetical protein
MNFKLGQTARRQSSVLAALNRKAKERTIDRATMADGWTPERRARQAALIRT